MLEFVGGSLFMLVVIGVTLVIFDLMNRWPDDY